MSVFLNSDIDNLLPAEKEDNSLFYSKRVFAFHSVFSIKIGDLKWSFKCMLLDIGVKNVDEQALKIFKHSFENKYFYIVVIDTNLTTLRAISNGLESVKTELMKNNAKGLEHGQKFQGKKYFFQSDEPLSSKNGGTYCFMFDASQENLDRAGIEMSLYSVNPSSKPVNAEKPSEMTVPPAAPVQPKAAAEQPKPVQPKAAEPPQPVQPKAAAEPPKQVEHPAVKPDEPIVEMFRPNSVKIGRHTIRSDGEITVLSVDASGKGMFELSDNATFLFIGTKLTQIVQGVVYSVK